MQNRIVRPGRLAVMTCIGMLVTGGAARADDLLSLCQCGTPQEISAAIKPGADINAKASIPQPNPYDGLTPIMIAARDNPHPGAISTLIAAGARVNEQDGNGMSPLQFAVMHNNRDVIAELLKQGADVEARSHDGTTPLMQAAACADDPGVIGQLLAAGAKIDDRANSGWTPVIYAAAFNKNSALFTALIKAGASIKEQDNDGKSVVAVAVRVNPGPEVIAAMVKAGADVKTADSAGTTPLMIAAASNRSPEMIDALLSAGADPRAKNSDGRDAAEIARLAQNWGAIPELIKAERAGETH